MKHNLAEWLTFLEKQDVFRIDLTLDRMQAAVDGLGLTPEKLAKKKIVTVAGTNGKGTTVTLLTHLLRESGATVGSYSSPHVFRFNERIQINLEPISDDAMVQAFNEVEECLLDYQLTYFEFVTLAAFKHFAAQDLDYLILEVGLGGRLDAVNAIDPDLAIITNIDFDHTKWLGDTREAIGKEKAGIIRAHKPVIYADENLPESIRERADMQQAELYRYGEHFALLESQTNQPSSYRVGQAEVAVPPFEGSPQQIASVLQAYYLLTSHLPETFHFEKLESKLIGRAQYFRCEATQYLFDVAHNEASIVRMIEKIISLDIKGRVRIVFSALADKPIQSMLAQLKPYVNEWYVTTIPNCKRARSMDELKQAFDAASIDGVLYFESPGAAFASAESSSQSEDLLICAGSFYLLSELEEEYKRCAQSR